MLLHGLLEPAVRRVLVARARGRRQLRLAERGLLFALLLVPLALEGVRGLGFPLSHAQNRKSTERQ